ncbi:hypothetical protein GCM10017567_18580 [Amycolatopsis bullii]|uniref:Uncharacterized protein n=1 Tax=Amycolatopsis bullii TaxID=941987 RepID=A0ABQ3K5Q1_9PSEU|nr:hypothetical protein GCM10017567_18580 [Amycolatopsis bullii]
MCNFDGRAVPEGDHAQGEWTVEPLTAGETIFEDNAIPGTDLFCHNGKKCALLCTPTPPLQKTHDRTLSGRTGAR